MDSGRTRFASGARDLTNNPNAVDSMLPCCIDSMPTDPYRQTTSCRYLRANPTLY